MSDPGYVLEGEDTALGRRLHGGGGRDQSDAATIQGMLGATVAGRGNVGPSPRALGGSHDPADTLSSGPGSRTVRE